MNILRRAALLVIALMSSQAAFAGTVTSTVGAIYSEGTYVLFKMNGTVSGKPSCSTNPNYDFAIPSSNVTLVSMLLSARLNQMQLIVVGAGVCTTYPIIENVDVIIML